MKQQSSSAELFLGAAHNRVAPMNVLYPELARTQWANHEGAMVLVKILLRAWSVWLLVNAFFAAPLAEKVMLLAHEFKIFLDSTQNTQSAQI
ncbi:hypothetical protein MRB53_040557 [Persea americana]|nr:hypothetical protein MRB53_040557 [Persea americana]